jgi:iron complex transport system substrate-binding protein
MPTTRRTFLALIGSVSGLAACGRRPGTLGGDVLAAGQPAALLVWAVARERLMGWPRRPGPAMLAALPAAAAALPELGALTTGGAPSNLEAMAALYPKLVIDYGNTGPEYQALSDRLRTRLGADWTLIDGALDRTAEALVEAGRLLGAEARGRALSGLAAEVLTRWRQAPPGPAFYYARGRDGLETAFAGALATEVLEGAGWTNVAGGSRDIGRVSREQVATWDPEAVVTLSRPFATAAAGDPLWRTRRDGSRRRLLLLPDTPFGWIDRPPSVNRLLGCLWLADPDGDGSAPAQLGQNLFGGPVSVTARPEWIA